MAKHSNHKIPTDELQEDREEDDIHDLAFDGNLRQLKKRIELKPKLVFHKDKRSATLLHQAAFRADGETAKYLISRGANINVKDVDGSTPLHNSAFNGSHEVLEFLLENGADVDPKDTSLRTPLHLAVTNNHKDCVALLLRSGADIHAVDSQDLTPLKTACYYGSSDALTILLSPSASSSATHTLSSASSSTSNQLPLEDKRSKMKKSSSTTSLPREKISKPDKTDFEPAKRSKEHENIRKDKQDIDKERTRDKTKEKDPERSRDKEKEKEKSREREKERERSTDKSKDKSKEGERTKQHRREDKESKSKENRWDFQLVTQEKLPHSALHICIQRGHKDCFSLLLKSKKSLFLDLIDENGMTPLHKAIEKQKEEMIIELLDAGAKVTAQDNSGNTPLHLLASSLFFSPSICDGLLSNNSNLFTYNKEGYLPLHSAAAKGNTDFLYHLIKNIAKLSIPDSLLTATATEPSSSSSSSSTSTKISSTKHAVLQLLSLPISHSNQPSAIHLASLKGYHKCVALLLESGVDIHCPDKNQSTPLHYSASSGHLKSSIVLIDRGADPFAKDNNGCQPIHRAACSGKLKLIKQLTDKMIERLQDKADEKRPSNMTTQKRDELLARVIDSQDSDKLIPLHNAAYYGHTECVQYFLDNNSNPNHVTRKGTSPLHYAVWNGSLSTINVLVSRGAKVNIQDRGGRSPLHFSVENLRLTRLLVERGADVNLTDKKSKTPLYYAEKAGCHEVADYLKLSGASTDRPPSLPPSHPPPPPPPAPPPSLSSSSSSTALPTLSKKAYKICSSTLTTSNSTPTLPHSSTSPSPSPYAAAKTMKPTSSSPMTSPLSLLSSSPSPSPSPSGARVLRPSTSTSSPRQSPSPSPTTGKMVHQNSYTNVKKSGSSTNILLSFNNPTSTSPSLPLPSSSSRELTSRSTSNIISSGKDHKPKKYVDLVPSTSTIITSNPSSPSPSPSGVGLGVDVGFPPRSNSYRSKEVSTVRTPSLASASSQTLSPPLHPHHGGGGGGGGGGSETGGSISDTSSPRHTGLASPRSDDDDLPQQAMMDYRNELSDSISEIMKDDRSSMVSREEKFLKIAAKKFNTSTSLSFDFLAESQYDISNAAHIAQFLLQTPGLSKVKIGTILGERDAFSLDILKHFVELLEFKNCSLDKALRLFLAKFRLPGEAQKIDRVMQAFSSKFVKDNPTVFANEDTAYILAFSLIILNTDAHNAQVKNKMKKDQFIRNHRDITKGEDLPPDYLSKLYDAIIKDKIEMEADLPDNPFEGAEKRGHLTKQGGKIKTWKQRYFIVSDSCLYYFKDESSTEPLGIVPLENLEIRPLAPSGGRHMLEIYTDMEGGEIKSCKMVSGALVPGHHKNYLLASENKEDIDDWLEAIKKNIRIDPFRVLIERKKINIKSNNTTNNHNNNSSSNNNNNNNNSSISISSSSSSIHRQAPQHHLSLTHQQSKGKPTAFAPDTSSFNLGKRRTSL